MAAPPQRTQAGQQLPEVEWLGQIVGGAAVGALHVAVSESSRSQLLAALLRDDHRNDEELADISTEVVHVRQESKRS
jgi:hypothetical protein